MRGIVADRTSPIAYGYDAQVPVYFSQAPVLNAGGGGFGAFGGGRGGGGLPGVGMNVAPMANPTNRLSTFDPENPESSFAPAADRVGRGGGDQSGFGGGRGGGVAGGASDGSRPRVVVRFPSNPDDMLLSGVLVGGQSLANRAQVVDMPLGQGHVVSFAIRPFWRWQTQGNYFLGFNTILNWNDLNAGVATTRPTTASQQR